jgi:hypothetical protein
MLFLTKNFGYVLSIILKLKMRFLIHNFSIFSNDYDDNCLKNIILGTLTHKKREIMGLF